MRSVIFAAGLAAPAMAAIGQPAPEQSTVYSTELVTITSCAATVTDCPARSTGTTSTIHTLTQSPVFSTKYNTISSSVTSTVFSVSSTFVTVSPPAATTPAATTPEVASAASSNSPVGETVVPGVGNTVSPVPTYSYTAVSPVYTTGVGAGAGSCSSIVNTITTSITTVIPTVIYETVAAPCVTGGASISGNSPVGAGHTTGAGSFPNNATMTASSPTAIVTAGASTWGASGAMAAVAGLFAMLA